MNNQEGDLQIELINHPLLGSVRFTCSWCVRKSCCPVHLPERRPGGYSTTLHIKIQKKIDKEINQGA